MRVYIILHLERDIMFRNEPKRTAGEREFFLWLMFPVFMPLLPPSASAKVHSSCGLSGTRKGERERERQRKLRGATAEWEGYFLSHFQLSGRSNKAPSQRLPFLGKIGKRLWTKIIIVLPIIQTMIWFLIIFKISKSGQPVITLCYLHQSHLCPRAKPQCSQSYLR